MTVLLGRKHVGVALNYRGGNASVHNQDKTITENGVYTADEGYTGLGTVEVNVESSGSGGATIEVLNKTGAVINQGDKVWLSENYQGEGNVFQIGSTGTSSIGGCIDRTGTFGVTNGKGYNIGDEEAVYAYDVAGATGRILIYGDDNSILTCAGDGNRFYRIDGKAQFSLNPNGVRSFCSKYLYNSNRGEYLRELNITTGESVKLWTLSTSATSVVVVDNTVYTFTNSTNSSSYPRYADLPEEGGGTITLDTRTSVANHTRKYLLPLGITSDNKYIVMANGNMGGNSLSGVTLFEILGKGQLKELSSGELPTDLQPYYSYPCYITFNPYTGVLTACVNGGADYVIMKYENGEWTKIPIERSFGDAISGPITLSDDLTKAFSPLYKQARYLAYIYNLPTTQGYSAIAYNTRNITDKTITATAIAESQPNELTRVQIGSVTNEDLTVTENGTYTPSATYTGFGSITVNVKGVETMQVPNKTGSAITKGQKVWLSKEARIAGESFSGIGSVSNTNSVAKLSPSGNFLWFNGKNYSVGNNSVSEIGSSSISAVSANKFKYGPNNQMFMTSASYSNYRASYSTIRLDEDNQYSVDYEYIGEDLGYNTNGIHRINVDDGTISETWATTLSSSYQETHIAVNGVIYDTNSTWGKYIFNGTDWEGIYTITADNKAKVYPINATADKKYIIASTYDSSYWQGGLRIIEIIDEDHLKLLTVGEMPIDLQTFYDSTTGIAFNPSSGLLSVMKANSSNVPTDFVIMKYNNGEWSKVPNTINLNDFSYVSTAVTVSNDASRVCINGRAQGVTSSIYPYIVNLTDVDGYSAVAYSPYVINEDTIIGYAGNDAEPNEEIVVGIASVPGSTPSVTGGSDTFEAQLILDNVVNSGTLKTEEEVINETVAVLKDILGE